MKLKQDFVFSNPFIGQKFQHFPRPNKRGPNEEKPTEDDIQIL